MLDNQSRKDELHAFQNLNGTKYANVELNTDHASQCIYTDDFIESQINGDDFDEWYSDVYPFCTGKSFTECLFANNEVMRLAPMRTNHGLTADECELSKKFLQMVYLEIDIIH